jgi:hypothetical protein
MAKSAQPDILVIWGDDIGISNLSCRAGCWDTARRAGAGQFDLPPGQRDSLHAILGSRVPPQVTKGPMAPPGPRIAHSVEDSVSVRCPPPARQG